MFSEQVRLYLHDVLLLVILVFLPLCAVSLRRIWMYSQQQTDMLRDVIEKLKSR
jgi:hypothetical protein